MFKLTLILFAFFSLVLPILAVFESASDQIVVEIDGKSATRAILTGSGRGTWYNVGLGSCGKTNSNADFIVAVSTNFGKQYCGKTITINSGGKSATAVVEDSCPSCGNGDIDMSPALFKQFASLDVGVLHISWSIY